MQAALRKDILGTTRPFASDAHDQHLHGAPCATTMPCNSQVWRVDLRGIKAEKHAANVGNSPEMQATLTTYRRSGTS